jgi:hypothetical protein
MIQKTFLFAFFIIFAHSSLLASTAAMTTKTVKLKYDLNFILEKVLSYKHLEANSSIINPIIYLKSKTPLKQFQDAIESQWGQRPKEFTNAYAVKNNEIYLLDDADYYKKTERFIDDSLAHELTHFVQVKYQNFDINDESLEWDAVDIQTWFRDNFCVK